VLRAGKLRAGVGHLNLMANCFGYLN